MIEECEDGDFDFFDIVIDWGEWWWWFWLFRYCDWLGRVNVLQQKQDQKRCVVLWTAWFDFVSEICWDYEWNEWEETDLDQIEWMFLANH